MRVVTEFPFAVREIENVWVPLPGGERMAARVWLPEGVESNPVPAILKYIPYRKRDFTRAGDDVMFRYFAGHGYACLRVDMRGSGDSEGLIQDEYSQQELDDGKVAIAWIARQPWCSGTVGMIGLSWSGFNALQIAALRPPALKAIVTCCSTDDRYADDMHMMGGCRLNDDLDWGTSFFNHVHRPPDPEVLGPNWHQVWRRRLDNGFFPPALWLQHQRRDAFWKHASVCENFDAIQCAVFAVGGWTDGYSNAIPRLLANLKVPRLGLIGPWAHNYGHVGNPGPAIGFLQECVRWWDQWLKGRDTGIMNEPMLRAYMQEGVPPKALYPVCPGRWVGEAAWPSARIKQRALHLNNPGTLDGKPRREARLDHKSLQTVGLAAGEWCSYGTGGSGPQFPGDQRADDGGSLVFQTEPLTKTVEILGAAEVHLDLAVDRPLAFVAVRLNDVYPDGSVARATYGVLNLTHRDGHEHPTPLVPGKRYAIRVRLNDIAYAFKVGHRIRVAVSTTFWPMIWPSPEPVTLSLFTGASRLVLPVRPAARADARIAFKPAEAGLPMAKTQLANPSFAYSCTRDPATGRVEIAAHEDQGRWRITDTGVELAHRVAERFVITDDDPLACATEITKISEMKKGDWDVRIEATSRLRATRDTWLLTGEIKAFDRGAEVFAKSYDCPIKRDLV